MGETTFIVTLIVFNILFLAFIAAIIIFISQYQLKKRGHLKDLNTMEKVHQTELLETHLEIQTQTMKHIGREIHDNVGQKLTLASIYTQQLAFENQAPQINQRIANISDIINQSLSDLRQLSKSLTDDSIEFYTLSELLKNECDKINDLKICKVHFDGYLPIGFSDYSKKSVLLRVTQEFMQNSIKHSNCENLRILLSLNQEKLLLKLEDDGKGFDLKNIKSKGIGLKNIEKRIDLIGGTFVLDSEINKGTLLTIEIPLHL